MNSKQNPSRVSAKSAFAFGVGSALVVGAIVFFVLRHDGRAVAATVAPPTTRVEASTPTMPPPSDATTVATTEPKPIPGHAMHAALPTAPADATPLISGTIALDPSIAHSITGKALVFVIARTGSAGGKGVHPVFAKRLDVTSFPVAFSLSAQDSMMGQAAPAKVSLEARIDLDGDAMTREPGAPSAKIDSVAIGSSNVSLVLKPGT
jgi:hypothetical protein